MDSDNLIPLYGDSMFTAGLVTRQIKHPLDSEKKDRTQHCSTFPHSPHGFICILSINTSVYLLYDSGHRVSREYSEDRCADML